MEGYHLSLAEEHSFVHVFEKMLIIKQLVWLLLVVFQGLGRLFCKRNSATIRIIVDLAEFF